MEPRVGAQPAPDLHLIFQENGVINVAVSTNLHGSQTPDCPYRLGYFISCLYCEVE
jgi:hypothetical protein